MSKECEKVEEANKENGKQRSKDLFATTEGFLVTDAQGRILEVSGAYCQMSGFSKQELLAMHMAQLEAIEKEDFVFTHIREILAQGCGRFQTQHRRKDGSVYDVEVSAQNRTTDGGQLVMFLRDITEFKRERESLKQREKMYRSVVTAMAEGIVYLAATGEITAINPAAEQILGRSANEMIGCTLDDLRLEGIYEDGCPFPSELQPAIIAKRSGEPQAEVVMGIHQGDGSLVWISISSQPVITNGKTAPYAVVMSFHDITKHMCVEAALSESEARLREAQRLAHIGNWEWNASPDRIFWSEELYRLFNFDPNLSEPSYEEHLKLYTPESGERLDSAVKQALQEGETYRLELEVVSNDNERRWVIARGEAMRDASGSIIGLRGTVQDITEHKQSEEEQAKLEAQLQQAQKFESLGRLAGGVAHDFNNILCVIIGQAELALDDLDPTLSLYARLKEIRKAAERSADLTRQLLAFARKQTVAPKVLYLDKAVTDLLSMLQRLISEEIQIELKQGADLWPVRIDPSQVDQILTNLCVNSRDAISDVGKITIETGNSLIDEYYCASPAVCVPGEYVRLAVSDNGCGMDKETLVNIFEPFFTTKEMGKGTGLGLSTVYGIVKQNNGFIRVYSELNIGTTFTIYLPRYVGEVAPPQTEDTNS